MRRRRCVVILLLVLLPLVPRSGAAQGSWLDGGQVDWNAPGAVVPSAPRPLGPVDSPCEDLVRPAETGEDDAVAAQGWRLFSAYQRGWGITLVSGFVGFDAQCRPVPYQQFVFVDGVFAGTLAPEPVVPRTDGAITDAAITAADRLYAVYSRYAPTDPLCCPSGEAVVTFAVERTAAGPVVVPELEGAAAPAAPATPAAVPTVAVCVSLGTGGDELALVEWTAEEIAAHEARAGAVSRPHPATGTCTDPAGLPVLREFLGGFSWVCLRTFDGRWYGPAWTAETYLPVDAVPPDPAIGGCPQPRDESIPSPPDAEQAAATAVYLSRLEVAGDLETLYAWLHPDAQAVVPEAAVAGWYREEWLPRGPEAIGVTGVDIGQWTWPVTGMTYPRTAEIAFEQAFADGSVVSDVLRLVQDDQGVWRWFFGRDAGFVEEQIDRFVDGGAGG